MEKLISDRKAIFIAIVMSLSISWAKIAFGLTKPITSCDTAFNDITSSVEVSPK